MFDALIRRARSWLPVTAGEFRLVLLFSVLAMLGAMVLVWSNFKMVKQSYEFQALKRENQNLLRENRLLVIEKESLQSLYRINDLARLQVGLRPAESSQMVTVFLK